MKVEETKQYKLTNDKGNEVIVSLGNIVKVTMKGIIKKNEVVIGALEEVVVDEWYSRRACSEDDTYIRLDTSRKYKKDTTRIYLNDIKSIEIINLEEE